MAKILSVRSTAAHPPALRTCRGCDPRNGAAGARSAAAAAPGPGERATTICTECNNGRVSSSTDGRGALREQRHRAILDAARTLAAEHGADGFTIGQVATLAGVSRRTVFNHVAGIDQLLVAVCEQILAEVTTDLLAGGRQRHGAPARGVVRRSGSAGRGCEATRGVDLPTAIVTITQVVGWDRRGARAGRMPSPVPPSTWSPVGCASGSLHRAPGLDPLDLELDPDPAHQRTVHHRPALARRSIPT